MTYRVEVAAAAEAAIKKYARFIAVDRESPLNAARWLRGILRAKDSLSHFPHRCPRAPENDHRPYEIRMHVVGEYLLLYTVDDDAKVVYVIGARHGRQKPLTEKLPTDAPSGD